MRLSHPDFRLFQLITFPASGDGAVFVLNQGDGINQRQTDFQPCHFIFIIHFDVNSWAIFSDSFYNVKNAVYDRDESECKNFAYVAGEGEGAARVIVEVDIRSNPNEERRELYVDARDLQSTYTDDNGSEHTYTQAQYRQLLRQRGLEKLAEYEKVETVNSDVDPDANLVYMTDFDLGDLCTYRYTDVGIETTKRITEIQEVYEGSKQTLSVVFGNDMATSITKIIKREAS